MASFCLGVKPGACPPQSLWGPRGCRLCLNAEARAGVGGGGRQRDRLRLVVSGPHLTLGVSCRVSRRGGEGTSVLSVTHVSACLLDVLSAGPPVKWVRASPGSEPEAGTASPLLMLFSPPISPSRRLLLSSQATFSICSLQGDPRMGQGRPGESDTPGSTPPCSSPAWRPGRSSQAFQPRFLVHKWGQ